MSLCCKAAFGSILALAVSPLSEWAQIAILGIVQGLTEFLPISSTGHLLITAELLDFQRSLGGTFEIFIQLGSVLAVLGFYRKDLFGQARSLLGQGPSDETRAARRLWLQIIAAFCPAAIIGLSLHHLIKAFLFRPWVIGLSLILGGIVFIVVERYYRREKTVGSLFQLTFRQALIVGAAQTLALIPGVSRSGASIVGGLLSGLDRPTATIFSFYLALPTLGGATVVDLLKSLGLLGPGDVQRLLFGATVSLVVSYLSMGWLLRYVSRHSFVPFGIYRILAGGCIGAWSIFGRMARRS